MNLATFKIRAFIDRRYFLYFCMNMNNAFKNQPFFFLAENNIFKHITKCNYSKMPII